jgi:hypothetical protein
VRRLFLFLLYMKIIHELGRLLLPAFGSFRCVHSLPVDQSSDLGFVAQQRTQLIARQREQHRHFNARQTRLELPIRPLQHRQILSSAEPYLRHHVVWRCVAVLFFFFFNAKQLMVPRDNAPGLLALSVLPDFGESQHST